MGVLTDKTSLVPSIDDNKMCKEYSSVGAFLKKFDDSRWEHVPLTPSLLVVESLLYPCSQSNLFSSPVSALETQL